ncbi:MAG: NlpC/P60 family protein, partial [bacterium]|nr:NlpC/P60 family protein [bacterium]
QGGVVTPMTRETVVFLRTLRVCRPHSTGAQRVLVPARLADLFEPLLSVRIDGRTDHGTTIEPCDPKALVLSSAREYLGKPFECMAAPRQAPDLFSCSTYTSFIFGLTGIYLPRYAANQSYCGNVVALETSLPGHLIFFGGEQAPVDADREVCHVGILTGRTELIHGSVTDNAIVEGRFRRTPVLVINPYPEADQVLVTLPSPIPDIDSALDLVRYHQKQALGR